MENSKISWTHHTFNPWRGCVKVSDGCKNCYAESLTKRAGLSLWGPNAERRKTSAAYWRQPAKWNREAIAAGERRRVFCASLADVFEKREVLEPWRSELFWLIAATPSLDWLLLTKRPENIWGMLPGTWSDKNPPFRNLWIGTSIEDMRVASRADHLRRVPVPVRFISYEPALGPLDDLDLAGISWVIYGAESGGGRRPEGVPGDPKLWARGMRDKCRAEGVAFWHKQSSAYRAGHGVELDGEIVHELPEPGR